MKSECRLSAAPWTIARQASLSMDFPGRNTGASCHSLLQGIFPTWGSNPGIKPVSLVSPALAGRFFSTERMREWKFHSGLRYSGNSTALLALATGGQWITAFWYCADLAKSSSLFFVRDRDGASSLIQQLLIDSYSVPGTALVTGDMTINKVDRNPCLFF